MSVWIRLLPNILTLLVNWISWQNIILEMLKYVTLNLFPLAHAASGQNTFLFFSIATVDSSHETGRSSRGLVTWSLFCATCSELLLHRLQGAKAMALVAEGTLLCLLPFPLLPLFMQVAAFAGSGLARSSFRTPFCGNECWSPELCSACTPWVTVVAGFFLPHCTTFCRFNICAASECTLFSGNFLSCGPCSLKPVLVSVSDLSSPLFIVFWMLPLPF